MARQSALPMWARHTERVLALVLPQWMLHRSHALNARFVSIHLLTLTRRGRW